MANRTNRSPSCERPLSSALSGDAHKKALEINPYDTEAHYNLAWILATWPDALIRDGAKAAEAAERADTLTRNASPVISATLAAAYAEAGRFADA